MWRRCSTFWRGIFALFFRSLRTESRSLRMHMLWSLLMIVIYISLWISREMAAFFGAPGLHFFRYVMYLDAAFITLLGVSYFATVISEEKEEDTLGLMTMAGIGSLGILLGKSTSRLFQVLLLLAIQYPFTQLAVTMGGLLPNQILAAYLALLAYTILLANVGLLCSVACRTNRNASGLTTFWLLGYVTAPIFAYGLWLHLTSVRGWSGAFPGQRLVLTVLDWLANSSVLLSLYEATETSYRFQWTVQLVGNTLGGLVCFLLSWLLFGFVAKEPATDSGSRGMVARSTNRQLAWFSAGRVWNRPLIWKDFFFTAGGWGGLLVRSGLYLGLYGLCYLAQRPSQQFSNNPIRWEDVTQGFQFFAHPLLAIDIALCASRVFHDEIKGQTLSSLLMIPRSIPDMVYSKVFGCALAIVPGILALLLSLFLPGGMRFVHEIADEPSFWWWQMNLVFMIHLTALFSLFLRTGAFVLALGTMVGSMMLTGFCLMLVSIASRANDSPDGVLGLLTVMQGLLCVGCHVIILKRMPVLGEK